MGRLAHLSMNPLVLSGVRLAVKYQYIYIYIHIYIYIYIRFIQKKIAFNIQMKVCLNLFISELRGYSGNGFKSDFKFGEAEKI